MKAKDRVKDLLEKLERSMIEQDLAKVEAMLESRDIILFNREQKIGGAFFLRKALERMEQAEGEGSPVEEAIREIELWISRIEDLPRTVDGEEAEAHTILNEAGLTNAVDRIKRRGVYYTLGKVVEILEAKR